MRTIEPVDTTPQVVLAMLLGGLVVGGAVFAWAISDRQQRRSPPTPPPAVPPGVAGVLSVLRSSAVVIDTDDRVLKASAPAYAYGLVAGQELASPQLLALVCKVRRDGQIREADLTLTRDGLQTRSLTARVAPLSTTQVLALVEDRTRERRVEAIRRDFVANVSHELKTPVGAIRLLAEAVGDAADDPKAVRRFSNRMLTEADRLSRLVQQVIELTRLQGDDAVEAPEDVAVDDVIAIAVDTSAIDADAKDVRLLTGGVRDLYVWGSRDQLTAALSNLVANAVAYSEPGGTVVVNSRLAADQVEISVIDRGVGIPAAEIDRIFERFYRVDPARQRSTGGTGLGLSIVKHVAASHGGDVRVWSVEGRGSTFTIALPRHQPPAAVPSVPPTIVQEVSP